MKSKINSFIWTWSLVIALGGLVLDFISDLNYNKICKE